MKMQSAEKSTFQLAGLRMDENVAMVSNFWRKARQTFIAVALIPLLLGVSASSSRADDELAKFAAAGHTVGVDGKCFLQKCPLETSECANDRTCLKGLSCLARYIEILLQAQSSELSHSFVCPCTCHISYLQDNYDWSNHYNIKSISEIIY